MRRLISKRRLSTQQSHLFSTEAKPAEESKKNDSKDQYVDLKQIKTTEEATGKGYSGIEKELKTDTASNKPPASIFWNFGFFSCLAIIAFYLFSRKNEKKAFKQLSDAELLVCKAKKKELEAIQEINRANIENIQLMKRIQSLEEQLKGDSKKK